MDDYMLHSEQLNTDGHVDFVMDDGRILPTQEFQSPEELYNELIEKVRRYHPSDDISLIEKAYQVAHDAHKDQVRKSGEPYIIHPLCVAIILAELEMDKETIAAGLLHDVVEDTSLTSEELGAQFGEEVELLVDGVTKLQNLQLSSEGTVMQSADKVEIQAENLRKMFLAMAKDIRVILIKLADRLHNMRTLKHMPAAKQQRIARETLDIYCPIAQRLGISKIKVELDDLSLKYLEPDIYYDLAHKIAMRKADRENFIANIVDEVSHEIAEAGIDAKIDGRIKHFFSIYKKMKNQNKTLDQIYDLFAVRIIVNSVKDCYAALGVIHEMYKPIPGRFKDYIAMPKANMYQSLHTTLIAGNGQPFEIQIRTFDMHRVAEYGIAAHWKYKEASDGKVPEVQEEEKLTWLRQILEWQQDMSDNKEFLNLLKSDLDLFSDSVYCFTPTGEVKNLPAGSTPIDFAYSIHSAVGNKMIGARVNGKLVTIDYEIQNGDRIEVITSQNSKGPSRDWLNICKSTQAKNKINQWFKAELKDVNITKGKELLTIYCKQKGINMPELMKPKYVEAIQAKYGFHDWESVLAAIGHGGLKEGQIINRMLELYDKDHKQKLTDEEVLAAVAENAQNKSVQIRPKSGIIVRGIHDVDVHFSKCCSPVPGDEIVGFVTRGRGISIHRTDCINIINLPEDERSRMIEAEWLAGESDKSEYTADIVIYANDRSGLLADVTKAFTEKGINIISLNTRTSKQGIATLELSFQVGGRDEMRSMVDKIRTIESVLDIERTSG
ncbi:MAG: bifunctional (p)ppGpp synthetase/guanosine-3',5'-bis(diphosphate) 3'-pyrophosphohydrolase [Lachnospiraceae bacterium]|nr:bifunctional (p)ppGpp synthetase/guanosine-3',5'-bis(diphosphate) 3'-pyrophosphohydrolase [Lachnospiraceae bacterium]